MLHLKIKNKMLNRLFIIHLMLLSNQGFGQFNETIRTGRPGQSIGPYAVGSKVLQIQSGFEFTDWSGVFRAKNYESALVVRFGITEKFELNTGWKYSNFASESQVKQSRSGFNLGSVGCRINIIDGEGYIPSIGLQTTLKFPRLSEDFFSKRLATKTVLIVRQKISKKLNLMSNFGLDYSGNSTSPAGLFVLNLGYNLTDKFGINIEAFGSYYKSSTKIYFDGSFRYLINPNLQLDLTVGGGRNLHATNIFYSAGFSWRLHKNKSLEYTL